MPSLTFTSPPPFSPLTSTRTCVTSSHKFLLPTIAPSALRPFISLLSFLSHLISISIISHLPVPAVLIARHSGTICSGMWVGSYSYQGGQRSSLGYRLTWRVAFGGIVGVSDMFWDLKCHKSQMWFRRICCWIWVEAIKYVNNYLCILKYLSLAFKFM